MGVCCRREARYVVQVRDLVRAHVVRLRRFNVTRLLDPRTDRYATNGSWLWGHGTVAWHEYSDERSTAARRSRSYRMLLRG